MTGALQPADVAVVAILAVALYTDLTRSRVPNQLTFGAMGLALLVAVSQGQLFGCLGGISMALAVMLPGWLLGGAIRAGDAKLLMAVGGFWGASLALKACILTYVLSFPAALCVLVWRGRLMSAPKKIWSAIKGQAEEQELTRVPWVPVIALAVLLAWVL